MSPHVFYTNRSITINGITSPPLLPVSLAAGSWDRRVVLPDGEERISVTTITESLKSTDKSFTIRTHGYSHETRSVSDCTRVRVSRMHSSFSLERLQVQKVHNVLNSSIATIRSVCACAQPPLGRSTAKMIKTGLRMTYPTIHTCISFFFNMNIQNMLHL